VTLLSTRWYLGCSPSTIAKLPHRTALVIKYSPLKKYPCVLTGNPQQVDEVVLN